MKVMKSLKMTLKLGGHSVGTKHHLNILKVILINWLHQTQCSPRETKQKIEVFAESFN